MPEPVLRFLPLFKRRWAINEARYKQLRDEELVSPGLHVVAVEIERCRLEQFAMLHEIVLRLSKESVSGAGVRDLAIGELIDAARIVAKSEGVALELAADAELRPLTSDSRCEGRP